MAVVAYVIAHAEFRAERVSHLESHILPRLESEDVHVVRDSIGVGSLDVFRRCLVTGLATDATHIVFLPDDAVLPEHYTRSVRAVIEAFPDRHICGLVNVPAEQVEGLASYETPDGSLLFGGIFPRAMAAEYMQWRERNLIDPWRPHTEGGIAGDEGANLWLMATGRTTVKPVPSLVDHLPESDAPSLDGNGNQTAVARASTVPFGDAVWQPGEHRALGRTYEHNHWKLITHTTGGPWMLQRACELQGGAAPSKPKVMLACPAYGGSLVSEMAIALYAEAEALRAAGVAANIMVTKGDSLVQRGRNEIVWRFLCSDSTHLLFWDSDIVPSRAGYVAEMLASGHDIVGGAYPFRNDSGGVVVNVFAGDTVAVDGFMPVAALGTGFLLISRRALLAMARNMWSELFYRSDATDTRGVPRLAFFDCGIRNEHGRRYMSEDYLFCRRWQDMGGRTWCMLDATFQHVGEKAFDGALRAQAVSL